MTIGQQVVDFQNGRASLGFSPAMLLGADAPTSELV